MNRVLIIGLDGATFDLIKPWAAEGKLPNLAMLLKDGTHGELKSTIPPMTFPSWTSFMTGKNPGKHGIFDFTERVPHAYEIRIVTAKDRQAKTSWKILSEAGKKVGIVGVPVTYPPEEINGVMISGFDTPTVGEKITFPTSLFYELKEKIGGYITSADFVKFIPKGQIDLALAAILEVVERKASTARYLLQRNSWDCFMIMFGETDACAHYFWKYHDKNSPHHNPSDSLSIADPILAVYQKIDRAVGEFIELVPKDTIIILVSDHGTGGAGDKVIHLNRWLESQGLLHFHYISRKQILKFLNDAKSWARAVLPKKIIKRLRFGQEGVGIKLEAKLRFSGIDWARTRAYSEETPYYPNIWINLKGREPHGIVTPDKEYEEIRDLLVGLLQEWRDPETGERVINKVYKREEIYWGEYVNKAPDIMISWNLDNGYSYLSRASYLSKKGLSIERVDNHEICNSKFMINRSGSHRDYGIFMIKGELIKNEEQLLGAEMIDLAPTILYLLGIPIPDDMDGRVLTECIKSGYLAVNPIRYCKREGQHESESEQVGETCSAEEEAKIKERLRELGYL